MSQTTTKVIARREQELIFSTSISPNQNQQQPRREESKTCLKILTSQRLSPFTRTETQITFQLLVKFLSLILLTTRTSNTLNPKTWLMDKVILLMERQVFLQQEVLSQVPSLTQGLYLTPEAYLFDPKAAQPAPDPLPSQCMLLLTSPFLFKFDTVISMMNIFILISSSQLTK